MKETLKSFGGTFLTVAVSLIVLGFLLPYLPQAIRKFIPLQN